MKVQVGAEVKYDLLKEKQKSVHKKHEDELKQMQEKVQEQEKPTIKMRTDIEASDHQTVILILVLY